MTLPDFHVDMDFSEHKAMIYCRPPDVQLQRRVCGLLCERHDIPVAGVIEDDVFNASRRVHPGMVQLLDAAVSGLMTVVVVQRLGRLHPGMIGQERWINELALHNVKVWSLDQQELDWLTGASEDPVRMLIREVNAVARDWEVTMMRHRRLVNVKNNARRAFKAAANRGVSKLGSWPRYGWMFDGENVVEHPGEQDVIDMMVEMHFNGVSNCGIANELNKRGIPSRGGGRWYDHVVKRILMRELNFSELS